MPNEDLISFGSRVEQLTIRQAIRFAAVLGFEACNSPVPDLARRSAHHFSLSLSNGRKNQATKFPPNTNNCTIPYLIPPFSVIKEREKRGSSGRMISSTHLPGEKKNPPHPTKPYAYLHSTSLPLDTVPLILLSHPAQVSFFVPNKQNV